MTGTDNKQVLTTFNDLPRIIKSFSSDKILLLTDPAVYDANALLEKLSSLFDTCSVKRVDVACRLLTVEFLKTIYTEITGFKPDSVLAIGGGTVLDTGKLINILLSYRIKPSDLIQFKSSNQPLIPMIAIPTTAGTGSEATYFAVIYKDNIKYSIADKNLIPDYVVLAPELTMSMPKNLAIHTGFDAFAQAVESYWSINSTEESKRYSIEALSLIKVNFIDSVLKESFQSRAAMQNAANLAGKAINIAQTTAAHSISYPMSSFFHIPHGLAVFLILPSVFAFNQMISDSDCNDPRGTVYIQETMNELSNAVSDHGKNPMETLLFFMEIFSVDPHLSSYGISTSQDITCILDNGFNPERMKNNPRIVTRNDLSIILQELL